MRGIVSIASVAIILAATLVPASAEPVGSHFELAPMGGFTTFDNDGYAGSGPLKDVFYVGGRVGYVWRPWLGLELAGGFSPTSQDVTSGADLDFYHGSLCLTSAPWTNRYLAPFVFVGGGGAKLKPTSGDDLDMGNLEAGVGLDVWLGDAIGVRVEARDLSWLPKDDVTNPAANTLVLAGGLTFALGGRPRDTDGDGVTDRKDQCPDTPPGATVDATGCPHDSDGDGVLDGLDRCPNTPKGATVDDRGCPRDSDGDGVPDGLDQCADTPAGARVDAHGCTSDSDGDGIVDGLDHCEGTPKGCVVDAQGCPKDSDNDGVCDGIDDCPDTSPGLKVDAHGCPIEVVDRETELLETGMIRLQNVNFETAKAEILPESDATLDVVGSVLAKWPALQIEIGGHTDARGSNAYNQKLSEARAEAVRAYLTSKFPALKPEQFTARGYGESKPLVPNTSALNMAKNRRVEFVVLNKDVLRREVERRRLLQKESAPPAGTPAAPDTTRH